MRLLVLLLAATSAAQSVLPQISHTAESLRGVSAISRQVAWASGTHGTYLRTTDGGRTWIPAQIHGAAGLDFRAVVAFSAYEAFLMSAGQGNQSRVYHTSDGGQHWQLQFTNTNPKGFFDSMVFWDARHGIVLGDPIPDETGKLKFELLFTDDGQTWSPLPPAQLPEALPGEGAFAASNSCIAVLASRKNDASPPDPNIWFASGGKAARVFHSHDRGRTWEVYETPVVHGADSAGIFSIAFRTPLDGVIAGGDYKQPKLDGPNLAFTYDGGKSWELSGVRPQAYFSAVAYDRSEAPHRGKGKRPSEKSKGHEGPAQEASRQRLFIVGPDFLYDLRPGQNPRQIVVEHGAAFNAVSPFPEGGALLVGAKGGIAVFP